MNRMHRIEFAAAPARIGWAAALGFAVLVPLLPGEAQGQAQAEARSEAPGEEDHDRDRRAQAADVHELPALGTVTRAFTRREPTGERLFLMSGVLGADSAAAPEAIGASFLAARPDVLGGVDPSSLRLGKVISFHRGQALRYQQTHRDLPVVGGGGTVVRLDEAGRVRWVASSARVIPDDLSVEPTLSPREALEHAARFVGYDQAFIDALDTDDTVRLAVYTQPAMDAPRLAYWVELPQDRARMAVWRGYVDAHTGHVYRMENKVVYGGLPACDPGTKRAYVYPENPIATPELVCVSLSDHIAVNQEFLVNQDIRTGNCVDNNGCRNVLGITDVHWCDDDPIARTAGSDFLTHQFTDDTDPEDTFAEVQMFYHLTRVFEVARSLGGFTNVNARPLAAVVNFRPPVDIAGDIVADLAEQTCTGPTYTGGAPLHAFDNAAFIPAGGFLGYPDTDGMVFGQGVSVDYAFDGDVVYHEFGHAVMNTVAPDLSFGRFDAYGFDPTPGGMHEGYADLMTLWVTDDPEIGEYAGTGLGLTEIRDLDNNHTCPAHLVGETHEDALPIAGAIWQAREAIYAAGGDKNAFDRAVFAAQQTFDGDENYESAAAKTIAEVELAMGGAAAETLAQVLAERGISDCDDRIADGTLTKQLLFAGALQMQVQGIMPAPVQFEYDLPDGAQTITIDIRRVVRLAAGLIGTPTLSVAMKAGDPIQWTSNASGLLGDYTTTADFVLTLDASGAGPGTVTLVGPFSPDTYYFQVYVQNGTYALVDTRILPEGTAPGGCGCAAQDSAGLSGMLLSGVLVMGTLALRRRRRTAA